MIGMVSHGSAISNPQKLADLLWFSIRHLEIRKRGGYEARLKKLLYHWIKAEHHSELKGPLWDSWSSACAGFRPVLK